MGTQLCPGMSPRASALDQTLPALWCSSSHSSPQRSPRCHTAPEHPDAAAMVTKIPFHHCALSRHAEDTTGARTWWMAESQCRGTWPDAGMGRDRIILEGKRRPANFPSGNGKNQSLVLPFGCLFSHPLCSQVRMTHLSSSSPAVTNMLPHCPSDTSGRNRPCPRPPCSAQITQSEDAWGREGPEEGRQSNLLLQERCASCAWMATRGHFMALKGNLGRPGCVSVSPLPSGPHLELGRGTWPAALSMQRSSPRVPAPPNGTSKKPMKGGNGRHAGFAEDLDELLPST